MAVYFIDSSALVKKYVSETGTAWVVSLTDPIACNAIYIAHITGVETIAAVTRRVRRGEIIPGNAATAISDFRLDFNTIYLPIEINSAVIVHAMDLAETHGLRGYDAVQLAAALSVHSAGLALVQFHRSYCGIGSSSSHS